MINNNQCVLYLFMKYTSMIGSGARWAEQPPTDQPSQLKNDDKYNDYSSANEILMSWIFDWLIVFFLFWCALDVH